MRIAVAATPAVAIPTLDALLASEHELVSVITKADAPAGRGRTLHSSPVSDWAGTNKVKVFKPESKEDLGELVKGLDLVVTIGYGLLIPAEILKTPRHGFINLHFSLLPAWRGAAPVQRAIENGDDHLGITVFALDAGMDTGPIYRQASFRMEHQMRSKEALEFLGEKGVELIAQALEDISQKIAPIAQSSDGISHAKKLSKEEALINWLLPVEKVDRKIAAFYPNPIAYTNFRNEVLKIIRSDVCSDFQSEKTLAPGELLIEKDRVLIGTGSNPLEVVQLIPQGKSEMKASDWARGARINPGERCG